jgi:hypothetical protein
MSLPSIWITATVSSAEVVSPDTLLSSEIVPFTGALIDAPTDSFSSFSTFSLCFAILSLTPQSDISVFILVRSSSFSFDTSSKIT